MTDLIYRADCIAAIEAAPNADDAIALIRALPAADAGALGAVVKPLVWRVQSYDCQVADTPWGSAAVQNESHALAPKRWGWWMVGSSEDDSPSGYGEDIDTAKAAAQADHETRVRAALEPPTHAAQLAAALALPEVAALHHALIVWDAAHRTGMNEPLHVAFELGQAALAALEARHDPA